MFVPGEGLEEGFAFVEAGEVEGLGPAVFVEFSGAVVVAYIESSVCDMLHRWEETDRL